MFLKKSKLNNRKNLTEHDMLHCLLVDKGISKKERAFLIDIHAYWHETDKAKRDELDEKIRDFILSNQKFIHNICITAPKNEPEFIEYHGEKVQVLRLGAYSDEDSIIKKFYDDERKELEKDLGAYRITLDKLAIVSIRSNYWDRSKWTKFEYNKPGYPGYAYDTGLNHNFNLGDVWEFAILSEDKKSFVLFRDLPDKKVRPISNCKIWKNSSIAEVLEKVPYHEINNYLPDKIFFNGSDKNVGQFFTEEEMARGMLLKDLYFNNLRRIKHQMNVIMCERSELMEKGKIEDAFMSKSIYKV